MKFYRPVKTNLITQGFGIAGTQPSLIPEYNALGLKAHDGIDFAVKCVDNHVKHGGQCEQVFCNVTDPLTVIYIQKDDTKGYGINAQNQAGDKFCWWHFDIINPILYVGATLKMGDLLGTSGDTGVSTGAHVHFGYYPAGTPLDNGYKGAADPSQLLDNRFVNDIVTQIGIIQKLIEAFRVLLGQ